MKTKPYQKQPGDYEIRVLKDSRLVLIGPDQELIDLARSLCPKPSEPPKERNNHGSTPDCTSSSQTE